MRRGGLPEPFSVCGRGRAETVSPVQRGYDGVTGGGLARAVVAIGAASLFVSCSVGSTPFGHDPKEYFSEAEYGKASPRVIAANRPVPKGGGRYLIGEPYRVAGKTYIPRDNPRYQATGLASWYGAAFHGRLTANGEVYDVNGLTAAHPTLPLPSYVRVTNLDNGRSLVVRVNDRGPFAHDRVIDVSARAADLLGFKRKGTAKVEVQYVAPARMDGRDTDTLLASYRGPGDAPNARSGLRRTQPAAAPIMVASAMPRLRRLPDSAFEPPPATGTDPMVLVPAYAPAAGQPDPLAALIINSGFVSSYAEAEVMSAAHRAAADLARADLTIALDRAAARKAAELGGPPAIVQVGSFADRTNAERAARAFSRFGTVTTVASDGEHGTVYVVTVAVPAPKTPDIVIAEASAMGLTGAFVTN